MSDVRQWVDTVAPADVLGAIRFLERSGYQLAPSDISRSFGNVQLRYSGEFVILITRDRGQWMLDVIVAGGKTFQLDLIAAGRAGRYPTERLSGTPEQIPPWISWTDELPGLLEWLATPDAEARIQAASRERFVVMWPDSHTARVIRSRWKKKDQKSAG